MSIVPDYLPEDFGMANAIAVALIFGLWGFYAPILKVIGRGSLNSQLHTVRMRWFQMHQGIDREHRVFDAILLGHISNSISFFGSGTLIVLAGLVGALANVNNIYLLTRGLKFVDKAPMRCARWPIPSPCWAGCRPRAPNHSRPR